MSQRTSTQRHTWKERALSLLLAAALTVGLIPGLTLPASAEHWSDTYLDQLVDWGVLRADQTSDPDAELTRAEFMAIINRAYGYTEMGPIPFEDVLETDWFYDDMSIAYTAGYMAGTSETTASPNETLTREQAFCILGRNMMMRDTPGENLAFSDSRDVSDWARGTIKAASDNYIISGYPDNTLHPQDFITKAQMAVLITQCVGNPIQQSGTYDLGGVFGNVTITAPNVTLRNAVISGDLYISGGVGLGGIKLENVDVLGRIIVSSTGESEGGDASVIMRNVTADEMLVDNMRNKTVTIRADGITDIARTVVRTNAYLEDNNTDDKGLMHIELDGEPGTRLTLAGRIKEVVTKTPNSYIQAAKGTVAKLTVDEAATNSTVQIDRNTKIAVVNLDVATSVIGDGDIGKLNINAPGCVVTMLPDEIYIRPGLTASIAGIIMDYQAAEEGSLDPRLLSGYPAARDIAPTGFRADFAANKKGTIYWAVSYVSDGSIGEDDLISPPSYGSKAITNGSLAAPTGGEEVSTQVGNLVVGGSYYLSALVVDEQKNRSPVKVISFSTPDNTVPSFAEGYPYMSRITRSVAQVTVMPTKTCKLYYALLPQGAKAPTVNELRAAAVTGNLGYGVRDVTKNTEDVFQVNRQPLEEMKTYVLYLWLTDIDGVNSSNITSLTFTTPDTTPPEFNPEATLSGNPGQTNVPLIVGLTEPGTVYWVVVPRGAVYPLPNNQNNADNEMDANGVRRAKLTSEFAKLQVMYGRNGFRAGSVRITNANTDTAMNITGLDPESAYDLYYVAQDNAGNFSVEVKKLAINTQDDMPPTVRQYFNRYAGRDNTRDPLVTTDIMLEFSEDIRTPGSERGLLDIWESVSSSDTADRAVEELNDLLSSGITLYQTSTTNRPEAVKLWDGEAPEPSAPWINFRNATVSSRDGHVTVTLPYNEDAFKSAHRLNSGSTYYFEFENITDNSDKLNEIVPNPVNYTDMGDNDIPAFTTVFAQVHLSVPAVSADRPIIRNISPDRNGVNKDENGDRPYGEAVIDYTFRMIPDATETVDKDHSYDLQLYTGSNVSFDLYCRIFDDETNDYLITAGQAAAAGITALPKGSDVADADENHWFYLGNSGSIIQKTEEDAGLRGVSVNGNNRMANLLNFPTVSSLDQSCTYDFVITVTSQGGDPERGVWTGKVDFEVHVLAGPSDRLKNLANDAYAKSREEYTSKPLTDEGLVSIGQTTSGEKFLSLSKTFIDSRVPRFDQGFPKITPGDSFADIVVTLDRAGTLYYVAAPLGGITTRANLITAEENATTTANPGSYTGEALWNRLPQQGQNMLVDGVLQIFYQGEGPEGERDEGSLYDITITSPNADQIMDQTAYQAYNCGVLPYGGGGAALNIPLRGLVAETPYIVYFVLKGVADEPSQVFAYAFTTTKSSNPRIALTDVLDGTVSISTRNGDSGVASKLTWIVFSHDGGMEVLESFEKNYGKIILPEEVGYYGTVITDETDPNAGKREVDWLTALTTSYNNATAKVAGDHEEFGSDKNGYSLFDLFASPEQKYQLDFIVINPGTQGGRVSDGTSETTSAGNFTDLAKWLERANRETDPSQTYLILVVGHNSASSADEWSEVDSFRALDGVSIVDSAPPKLRDKNGDVLGTGVTASLWNNGDANGTYSGFITLSFDKNLYWREDKESETRYAVTGGFNGKTAAAPYTVGLLSETSPPLAVGSDGTTRNVFGGGTISASGQGYDFYIGFDQLTASTAYIMPLNTGYFTSETGTNTEGNLSITVSRRTTKSELVITYNFEIVVKFGSQTATYTETVTEPVEQPPAATAPALTGINTSNVKGTDTGSYSLNLGLTFDQDLYTKTGDSTTAVDGEKLATKTSVNYIPEKSGSSLGDISSSGYGRSYTLTLKNVKPGTITLPSQTFYDETGQASTTGTITVEISEVTSSGNAAGMAITTPRITVSFGDFEQTKILK